MSNLKREYDVFAANTYAKVFEGSGDEVGEDNDCWVDAEGDLLIDTVWAENEETAVGKVAEFAGLPPEALTAVQRKAGASDPGTQGRPKMPVASAYADDDTVGIRIEMPNGEVIHVAVNNNTGETKICRTENG